MKFYRLKFLHLLILILVLNSIYLLLTVNKSKNNIPVSIVLDNQANILNTIINSSISSNRYGSFNGEIIIKSPTIFCMILTSKKNFETKAKTIFETWVKKLFLTLMNN
jgi:hypothetical protein